MQTAQQNHHQRAELRSKDYKMKFRKKTWLTAYCLVLMAFTVYFLLDTFVIARVYSAEGSGISQGTAVSSQSAQSGLQDTKQSGEQDSLQSSEQNDTDTQGSQDNNNSGGIGLMLGGAGTENAIDTSPVITENSYKDENISITIDTFRVSDTTVYVADIQVSSEEYLRTALAKGVYGRNVTATTSDTAESVGAILAINGDYYGSQQKGYVIRNGVLYRNTSDGGEDLVIYKDGSFGIINEKEVSAEQLLADGAQQVLSFGPALVEDGQISVGKNDEVGKAMASNPRTAIGIISEGHYLFVVSDGRTSASDGLSVYELAQIMQQLGAKTAYNLDGGGSSTLYFNGEVINNPTTSGRNTSERKVSDIVYIGY